MLKVMSLNVMCWEKEPYALFENRRPLIKKAVSESGPDVIVFQEVKPCWTEWFESDLKGYENYTVYRDESRPEGTPIYWNPQKVKKLECGHFWLSETPETESIGWDAACKRTALWALFEVIESGKKFVFVNTHLDHVGREAQINGIKLITDFVKQNFAETSLVLTGDFNATPDSQVIGLTNEILVDARTVCGITEFEPTYHGFSDRGIVIDYIYLSRDIKCTGFETIKTEKDGTILSDHYGLVAGIEF